MRPLLYQGRTHVVVEQVVGVLRPNDLPIYRRGDGKYVLHRIISVGEGCYYIRGDNCIGMEIVPQQQVIGVVTRIYRNGKYLEMNDQNYLRYVSVWNAIYPLRSLWLRLRGVLSSIKSRVVRV